MKSVIRAKIPEPRPERSLNLSFSSVDIVLFCTEGAENRTKLVQYIV